MTTTTDGSSSVQSARPRRVLDARAALVLFGAIEVVSIPLLLWWGRNVWFISDDWDFLARRTGGSPSDLIRPHFEHWTTLPILAYRLLWSLVGLRSYVPYQMLVVLAHLTVAALLRAIMRRANVGPWLSTAAATLFVFFGAGAENILVAFQVTFVAALAFGLIHLVLADHSGPLDRRDGLGLLAGFAGLLCSGVAVTMTVVVGVAMLWRGRGWRIALLHTAPLAAIYLIWHQVAPRGRAATKFHATTPTEVLRFVLIGMQAAFGGLGQLPGLWLVLLSLLVIGLAMAYVTRDRAAFRSVMAAPMALLAGAIVFLLVTGLFRSGQRGGLVNFGHTGVERARESRYVYVVGAMLLPALALAADAIIRRWRQAAVAVVALWLLAIPGNIDHLVNYSPRGAGARASRSFILTAPRLPIAHKLPRSSLIAPDLPIGWLIASLPSGRIPDPGRRSRTGDADATLRLALAPSFVPETTRCRTLRRPAVGILQEGQVITVNGEATIAYVPIGSAPSQERAFNPTSLQALAGPLRIRVAPTHGPVTLCGLAI